MTARRTEYCITLDAHCRTTDVCIKTRLGKPVLAEHLSTSIPRLREVIESVPRPRYLAFEESSIAGWLYRGLRDLADETVVCDPRRNAHIAKDGDKSDRIDAEKLNDLYRSGMLRRVHQSDSDQHAAVKQLVGMYHDRVAHRVGEGNRLLGLAKRWGLILHAPELLGEKGQEHLLKALSQARVPSMLGGVIQDLRESWQQAMAQEEVLYEQVCLLVKKDQAMRRTAELPGYGPVRAATLISYLETPWRFKSKSALWKYTGIGLRYSHSGDGPEFLCVEQACNHLLRNMVIGAAKSAIEQKENVFARRYDQWIDQGLAPKNARRNVARLQVSTIWGMWKTQSAFDPALIG